jgi:NADPH2:quinone reductase
MTHGIRIHGHGGPEALVYEPFELGPPAAGEVRLRQTAVGLNFIDTYHRSGLYPLPGFPHGLGVSAAGVVESLGPGVTEVAPGDRVAYAGGPPGAYAEARNYPADRLVKIPDGLDDETVAASILQGLTAEYLVRRTFPVGAGTKLLVHAAAGGVGLLLCQWAHHLGALVIGTVSTEAKATIARANGCDHVLVTSGASRSRNATNSKGPASPDDPSGFAARCRALTGGAGVDVVYDSIGKDTFEGSLACLRPRGLLVSFGNASGPPPAVDPLELSRRGSLYLTRPTLQDYVREREELVEAAETLFGLLASGALVATVGQRYPLREAAEAHRALEGRRTHGSTVLLP